MSTKNETKPKSAATEKPASTTPKAKDLPAKKDAMGGTTSYTSRPNHNETLVRS